MKKVVILGVITLATLFLAGCAGEGFSTEGGASKAPLNTSFLSTLGTFIRRAKWSKNT